MTIHLNPRYFIHEGGTKFYEVVQFWDPTASVFACVRRWGKVGTSGEVQVIVLPSRAMLDNDAYRIIQQKTKRGYEPAFNADRLHQITAIADSELNATLTAHYGSMNAAKVAHHFDPVQRLKGVEATSIIVDEAAEVVFEEPPPPPDRGTSWGSW